jgi:hypothetical protein
MGRGESNILYNPPKLIARTNSLPEIVLGDKKTFAFPARELFLGKEGGILLQEDGNRAFPLVLSDGKKGGRGMTKRQGINISKSNPLSLNDEGLLYSYEDTIYFKKREEIAEDPFIYPLYESGKVLGLYAGKEEIYYLWIDLVGQGDVHFSSIKRGLASTIPVNHSLHQERVMLENKDDKSVLFYYPEEDRPAMLQTITSDGPGKARKLDSQTERHLFSVSYENLLHDVGEHHLVPGAEDGEYFYEHPGSGMIHFLDLDKGENKVIADTKDLDGRFRGTHALSFSRGFLYLLQDKRLLLISENGLQQDVSLPGDFTKIALGEDKAILWNPGDRAYQEVMIRN